MIWEVLYKESYGEWKPKMKFPFPAPMLPGKEKEKPKAEKRAEISPIRWKKKYQKWANGKRHPPGAPSITMWIDGSYIVGDPIQPPAVMFNQMAPPVGPPVQLTRWSPPPLPVAPPPQFFNPPPPQPNAIPTRMASPSFFNQPPPQPYEYQTRMAPYEYQTRMAPYDYLSRLSPEEYFDAPGLPILSDTSFIRKNGKMAKKKKTGKCYVQ